MCPEDSKVSQILRFWNFLKIHNCMLKYIFSNLWVAQNRRFVINPVYPGGGTLVAKILDFRLTESQKNAFSNTFCSPKLSLGSWILHCLCIVELVNSVVNLKKKKIINIWHSSQDHLKTGYFLKKRIRGWELSFYNESLLFKMVELEHMY